MPTKINKTETAQTTQIHDLDVTEAEISGRKVRMVTGVRTSSDSDALAITEFLLTRLPINFQSSNCYVHILGSGAEKTNKGALRKWVKRVLDNPSMLPDTGHDICSEFYQLLIKTLMSIHE